MIHCSIYEKRIFFHETMHLLLWRPDKNNLLNVTKTPNTLLIVILLH